MFGAVHVFGCLTPLPRSSSRDCLGPALDRWVSACPIGCWKTCAKNLLRIVSHTAMMEATWNEALHIKGTLVPRAILLLCTPFSLTILLSIRIFFSLCL